MKTSASKTPLPYPLKRWLHNVDRLHLCLMAVSENIAVGLGNRIYPAPNGGGGPPPEPDPSDKPWIKWFKYSSRVLFNAISELNWTLKLLSADCKTWNPTRLPFGKSGDIVDSRSLWDRFLKEFNDPSAEEMLRNTQRSLNKIREVLTKPDLPWPPLGNGDGTVFAHPANRAYISNNGEDVKIELPAFRPLEFEVFDNNKISLGKASIIFTQDCEWPAAGQTEGADWRSWGIVTNFSLCIISHEVKNSYSSSSSYYSTSSKIG